MFSYERDEDGFVINNHRKKQVAYVYDEGMAERIVYCLNVSKLANKCDPNCGE